MLTSEDALSAIQDVDFAAAVTQSNQKEVLRDAATATLKTSFSAFGNIADLIRDSLRAG
jgi:flagellin-like hook-associated protein FlgL